MDIATIATAAAFFSFLFEVIILVTAWDASPSFHVSAGSDSWQPTDGNPETGDKGELGLLQEQFKEVFDEQQVVVTRQDVNVRTEFVNPLRFAVVQWGSVFNAFVFTASIIALVLKH